MIGLGFLALPLAAAYAFGASAQPPSPEHPERDTLPARERRRPKKRAEPPKRNRAKRRALASALRTLVRDAPGPRKPKREPKPKPKPKRKGKGGAKGGSRPPALKDIDSLLVNLRGPAKLRRKAKPVAKAKPAAKAKAVAKSRPKSAPAVVSAKVAAAELYDYVTRVERDPRKWGDRRGGNPRIAESQGLMGLTPDGIYGPRTRARGKELLGKSFPPRR
jgi:hypothetical protein